MIGISPRRTYLDWASAAPVSPRAWRAFMNATKLFGNPGSVHADGVAARVVLEEARTRIARLAGTKSDGVIFTSGATESNNLSILGYLHLNMKEMSLEEMHVLYLSSAHSSTTGPVERFGSVGVQIEPIALQGATIDEEALKKQIRPTTVLVVMEAVCGETGTRFDTRNVRRILNAISPDRHIALHVDASQLPLVGSFEHTHLGADMITLDAQKVGGVRGSGVLILPKMFALQPLAFGGGQQHALRPGTETPALAAAFAEALSEAADNRETFLVHAQTLKEEMVRMLSVLESVEVNGTNQVPHILNISLLGRDTDYLLMLLDADGFSVSTKSACESDADGSRPVRIFTDDRERASSTLRISWGPTTTLRDVRRCAASLIRNVRFIDTR